MPDARATCPSAQQLSDYGLGKLPDGQLQAVAAHLEGCDDCRGRVEGQPPDSFVGRLRDAAPKGGTLAPRPSPSLSGSGSVPPQRREVAPPAPADLPAALAGSAKFEVLGKLGQGGMGAVWKARRTLLQDVVAIKVMGADVAGVADARQRFVREMQAVARLRHRHIVQAFDAEESGGLLFLVMECVEGVSLDRLVAQKGPLPVAFACRCAVQAAEGLQHAHEHGMVHRDIKPANLMVTAKEKEVKVLDFGLARAPVGQAPQDRTRVQTFMGTPEYVAPEQATDARSADTRADVYSLGCTLYFLLAGRPPFQRDTPMNTILAHLQEEPPPLAEARPGVPAALCAVVAKMLAKRPEDRYQTPREAALALKPFAAGRPNEGGEVAATEARSVAPRPAPSRVRTAAPFEALDDAPEVVAKPASGARRRPAPAAGGGGKKWLVLGGVAAAGLLGAVLAAVLLLRVRTAEGTVEVEIDQADAEVFLDGRKIDVRVRGEKEPITIQVPEGKHQLKVTKGGFETHTEEFSYRKGDKTVLRVQLKRPPVVAGPKPPADPPGAGAKPGEGDTPASADGFVPLFNGKDLDGWFVESGDKKQFRAEGGTLVASNRDLETQNYLLSEKEYSHYRLRFDCRPDKGSNTAVVVRGAKGETAVVGQRRWVTHPALKLTDAEKYPKYLPGATHWVASGDKNGPAPAKADFRAGEWNAVELEVKGRTCRAWINGKLVVRLSLDEANKAGPFPAALARARGHVGFQAHTGTARFRNIEIKELPPSEGEAGGSRRADEEPKPDRKARIGSGTWRVEKGELVHTDAVTGNCCLLFGDPGWTDYDYSFEVVKTNGAFGVSAIFRASDLKNYTLFDLAGWQNRKYTVECFVGGRQNWVVLNRPGSMAKGKKYRVLVKARGGHFRCYVNGALIYDFHDKRHARGAVGFRCWGGAVRINSIKVSSPDGKILWEGAPELKTPGK